MPQSVGVLTSFARQCKKSFLCRKKWWSYCCLVRFQTIYYIFNLRHAFKKCKQSLQIYMSGLKCYLPWDFTIHREISLFYWEYIVMIFSHNLEHEVFEHWSVCFVFFFVNAYAVYIILSISFWKISKELSLQDSTKMPLK